MNMDLLQDPGFWYAVAFVIFIGVATVFARKPALSWIDNEIVLIGKELEQARALRAEAEASLATYSKKQAEALAEAAAIIKHAEEQAAEVKAKAQADLQAALERQEQQAVSRIRMAESEAIEQVRNATIDLAMQMVRETLAGQSDAILSARLIEQAVRELPSSGPAAKAKAA